MQAPTGRGFIAPTNSWHQMGVTGQHHAPAALYLRGRNPSTRWIGDWMGLRAGLDTRGYRNNHLPLPQIEPRSSSVYLLEVSQVVPSLEAFQPKWSKPRYFSFPPSVLYVSPISTFIQSPHSIRRRQQIVTLRKMQFSSRLCYFAFHEQGPLIRSWTMNN
jgi:hypothetical protein